MNPKISIIVPVYKVEPYIHKCVDSILAQTLTDFELILVDDGSPDQCGIICDEYAKKDDRIKVIHKINGGQASARNAALNIAKGAYIGFVDSDDWIEPDMYDLLYNICIENECDIANCTSIVHYNDKIIVNESQPLTIHSRNQAMKALFEGVLYDEVVWSKLIKRELLENLRFPEGVMYEDTAFTYKVINESEKVCYIGQPKYHYIKRENSTMDLAVKNKSIDAVLIYDEIYRYVRQHYPELKPIVTLKLANNAMAVLNTISLDPNSNLYQKEYKKVTSILNNYFAETIRIKEYVINVKILLLVTRIHPIFYKVIINILSRRKRR
ncbi:glycosyltransferase [Bacillus sp. AFS017336]|uniref:glycosyltransferase family 2 protein n=1 Tax=Bacillus sp. AFS017336 TaxID=2033489 RepID=UPI000BF24881|nr:glycosyltransferase [Bacillus sp. AFS017336]PEL07026.1 glycosyl transferase [Bacillus sp. AFS017336]